MNDTLQEVLDNLPTPPKKQPYWLAYSGGLDSSVLLHALLHSSAGQQHGVHALHIQHGLQAEAPAWAEHCRQQSTAWGADFSCLSVQINAKKGNLEERARKARYQALLQLLPKQALLLTAQHRDDQAETLLLQLLRGAGPAGLAAMPAERAWQHIRLLRPLLVCSRQQLHHYAQHHQLNWIDDPSNQDIRFARNRIRHRLMPVIKEHWPEAASILSRSARYCAEANQLNQELADMDWQCINGHQHPLLISGLQKLSAIRCRNMLRHVLQHHGLAMPNSKRIHSLNQQIQHCRTDRQLYISWPGVEARSWRGHLYLLPSSSALPNDWNTDWLPKKDNIFQLPDGRQLSIENCPGGLPTSLLDQPLKIGLRQGGERFLPSGRKQHSSVKKWLQNKSIPPWERTQILFFYDQDRLLAVGEWLNKEHQIPTEQSGWRPMIKNHS